MPSNPLVLIIPAALGAAFLIALSITATFGLVSFDFAPEEATAPQAAPDNAMEGVPAYNVGIPDKSAPKVFFANIRDGATVTSPVFLEFGMVGMNVAPAGEVMEGTGHHHLLIDTPLSDLVPGEPLAATGQVLHFGDGSTSTTLEFAPGTYTLQLLAANGMHVPADPMVASAPITITVQESVAATEPLFEETYGPLFAQD
jgi:hypothetical protein